MWIFASLASLAGAEEGLWLANEFPQDAFQKRYGSIVSQDLLDRLRSAAVRFNSGGSGAFVSSAGLIVTNHHVGADCIQKLGSRNQDYLKKGFLAPEPAAEIRCPDLELNVLRTIATVTPQVLEGISDEASPGETKRALQANIARIEKECSVRTGHRCDVVPLFGGARFDLYEYKKYTDVRLTFAPEFSIAFFGGDPANFTYPRYCLDVAFFRAYEQGVPAKPEAYLSWSRTGARKEEPVIVAGHPGSTQRLATVANLEFNRDVQLPLQIRRYRELLAAIDRYDNLGVEQKRQANDIRFSVSNSLKAALGFLEGLNDQRLMERKRSDEARLRDAFQTAAQWEPDPWAAAAKAFETMRPDYHRYFCFEYLLVGASEVMWFARTFLRLEAENRKPDGERLKEFHDSARPMLEQYLLSPAPLYRDLEIAVLAENLRFLAEELGSEDPLVRRLLEGRTPAEAAKAAIDSTSLFDLDTRKGLLENPASVHELKNDEAIRLVRVVDEAAREYRRRWEEGVQGVLMKIAEPLARARYRIDGGRAYPDATFTLRFTYGAIRGYQDRTGRRVPWATDFRGLYAAATSKEPLRLPDTWRQSKTKVRLDTAFNFAATTDIHGGNSGSPTVNRKGEIVGIVFDSNLEGLPNRYVYDEERARSLHVSSQAVLEALRRVYRADSLVKELGF